ncbi:MAG: polysaccharide deacetylase family protein [Bacteroidales bacterium]|nr:polysaccharide deacetylase family protein [Bacteroidales bacterium]
MQDKIIIYTESKFLPEKKYVFQVIFNEILGINYEFFDTSVSQVYKFVLPNGKYIEFADCFFTNIPESIGYCFAKYLPSKISELKGVLSDEVVPFLYGNNTYTEHAKTLYCGGDIIGSSFFMLSRWEELISEKFDRWGRFPEKDACAVKYGFIQKPLVHVYAELLRKIFADYGFEIPQNQIFRKTLTHDVDYIYKWGRSKDFLKSCCADLFKRFSVRTFKSSLKMRKSGQDPYDMYSYLMDLSEKNGLKSTFYFLNNKLNDWELNTEKGKEIISLIQKRNHNVGIHSNYYLEADSEKVKIDKEYYSKIFNRELIHNRQHFLKMRFPQTLRMLEQNGIIQDSSMYYPHFPGFRTGMCIEHSVFDCETRKIMNIKELPLTLMDVSLLKARKNDEAKDMVDALISTVKKYNGNFVCLWHNSSFNAKEWNFLDGIYEYVVNA